MRTHPERYGAVLRVRPEYFEEYKRAHEAVWPEVLETISKCHIRNYSIYHHDTQIHHLLVLHILHNK